MDNEYNENQELLDRFRRALAGKAQDDAFFDEDDLLDIFDFAGDAGDDYLRAEALLWGARYYPDSERLRERRAIFYADLMGDNAVRAFTEDNGIPSTLLSRLVNYRAREHDQSAARSLIEEAVKGADKIDDEETIQLVDYAGETGNIDYIVDNLEMLKGKVTYKPALLYELSAELIDMQMFDRAVPVLDDLVTEMPYSDEYWALMATAQMHTGNNEAAMNSVEMALAIKPDSQSALVTRALLLQTSGNVSELAKMHDQYPDITAITQSYVQALWPMIPTDPGLRALAIRLTRQILQAEPDNQTMVTALLLMDPNADAADVERFWATVAERTSAAEWLEWAHQMLLYRRFDRCLDILTLFAKYNTPLANSESDETHRFVHVLMECLLHMQQYGQVMAVFDNACKAGFTSSPVSFTMAAVAAVRMGCLDDAKRYVAAFRDSHAHLLAERANVFDNADALSDIPFDITSLWTARTFDELSRVIDNPDFDWANYDPLQLW